MVKKTYLKDFGIPIKFTVLDEDNIAIDISMASGIIFTFEKPDTSQVEKDGQLLTDGVDGQVFYVTESGLFDQSGYWKVNALITSPVYRYTTDVARFKVAEEL